MADSSRLANMKEAHYEADHIAADLFDTVSVESNDEHIERDPRFVQDRFRVDRKKLEQMLQSKLSDCVQKRLSLKSDCWFDVYGLAMHF